MSLRGCVMEKNFREGPGDSLVDRVSMTYGKIIISMPIKSLRSVVSFQKSSFGSHMTLPKSSWKTESNNKPQISAGAQSEPRLY